jgi:hypothetical protein
VVGLNQSILKVINVVNVINVMNIINVVGVGNHSGLITVELRVYEERIRID